MTKAWHILILVVVAFGSSSNDSNPLFTIGGDRLKSVFVFDTSQAGIRDDAVFSVLTGDEKAMVNYAAGQAKHRTGDNGSLFSDQTR